MWRVTVLALDRPGRFKTELVDDLTAGIDKLSLALHPTMRGRWPWITVRWLNYKPIGSFTVHAEIPKPLRGTRLAYNVVWYRKDYRKCT